MRGACPRPRRRLKANESNTDPDGLSNGNRCAADAYHQHGALCADRFVVQVDADDRVGPEIPRLFGKLFKSDLARFLQFGLIRSGSSANDIANAGEEVLEDVRAEDGFAGDHAVVMSDGLAFDDRRGRQQHQ